MNTRNITFTLACMLLSLGACKADFSSLPCTSALLNGLSPEQQSACMECGKTKCESAGTGDTGEELTTDLTCSIDLDFETHTEYCAKGTWTAEQMGEAAGQVVHIDSSQCRTLSTNAFPCYRNWSYQEIEGGPTECVACDLLIGTHAEVGGPSAWLDTFGPFTPRQVDWGVCFDNGMYYGSGLHADPNAGNLTAEQQTAPYAEAWAEPLYCTNGQWRSTTVPHECYVVQIRDGSPGSNEVGLNWTCECASDEDCQPGAVCAAGYGPLGLPTLCTWDDGSGTPNGPAPEGPVVYGLDDFADGFTLRPGLIEISAETAVVLASDAAPIFNDDHLFDIDVTATGVTLTLMHCGPDALCTWLGWPEGTEITVTEAGLMAAIDEDPATTGTLDVVFPSGSRETYTIVVN